MKKDDSFVYKQALLISICLACAHAGMLLLFLYIHVYEMVVYNIVSILYFGILSYLAKSKKLRSNILVIMNECEIVLHQILAVCFVGLDFGFQYILLSQMVPITLVLKDERFKIYTIIKNLFCVCAFFILFLMNQNVEPVYVIDNVALKNMCTIFIVLFTVAAESYIILTSYRQLENMVRKSQENEILENKKRIQIQGNIIAAIASIIESRDTSTGEHTIRTSQYVGLIANQLKKQNKYQAVITNDYIENLMSAASLHDIGKISTPDSILNKPGKLDEDEYEIIKQHAAEGGEIIHKILVDIENEIYVQMAYEIATYHHERWDGKGYPQKLQGDNIPLNARIMAVADVYDALISSRCYKKGFSKETSTDIILEGRGTQFDPDVVDAFMELRKQDAL
ncbi:MAG: HD domain-containing protein [Eubacteriales bacterium]|nr:HD domain-containing protein [Eubacteriales bacterium]